MFLQSANLPQTVTNILGKAMFKHALGKISTAMRWHRLEILTTQWCETGGSRF